MVRFEYIPEDDEDFTSLSKLEVGLTGEDSVYDYFTVWKAFMTSLTFGMNDYSLKKENRDKDNETI